MSDSPDELKNSSFLTFLIDFEVTFTTPEQNY